MSLSQMLQFKIQIQNIALLNLVSVSLFSANIWVVNLSGFEYLLVLIHIHIPPVHERAGIFYILSFSQWGERVACMN